MNRYTLLMIVCYAIPLAWIFFLPYLGLTLSSGAWLLLVLLACPAMHLLVRGRAARTRFKGAAPEDPRRHTAVAPKGDTRSMESPVNERRTP